MVSPKPRVVADAGAALGLLAVGLAIAFWPMWSSGFALMQVDPADTRHLNFVLEWGHRWLTGQATSVWSPPFFHPEVNVSAYTEVLLGLVPFYSAWRALGFEPDSAFQGWMVTMAVLNFLAAWLLMRKGLGFEGPAAAVGAFVLSFGGVRLNQLNHQHLLPQFFTFIALWALVSVFRGAPRPRRWLVCFTASSVLQVYAGIQLGWFLALSLAVAVGWALTQGELRARTLTLLREQRWAVLCCGITALLALWPLAHSYLAAGRAVGFRSFQEARSMLPWAQSWLYQGPHNWLYGGLARLHLFQQLPTEGEQRLGLGLVTSVVIVASLWRHRRQPGWAVLGLTSATLMLLSTTHGSFSPWQVVMAVVPGATGIRAVARIGLMLLIPAGVVLAHLTQTAPRRWAWPVVAFCLLEQGQRVADSYGKQSQRDEVAQVVRAVPPECTSFFWAPRGPVAYDEKTQVNAMWAALELGVPTLNGYSSNFPREWKLMHHTISTERDEVRLRTDFMSWVVAHELDATATCFLSPEP